MKRLMIFALAAATALSAYARPATASQKVLDGIVRGDILAHAAVSVLAVTNDGDTIAKYNPSMMLVPASNMKLVTTGVALNELGGKHRFVTELCYSGKIDDGVLKGDLYICGGGDPTLASNDSIATHAQALLASWKNMVVKAGILRIDGYVIGDGRWFDGPLEDGTWQWCDIGTYYGTGCSGLNFYENCKDFRVSPGNAPGQDVNIVEGYPQTPWMTYAYECTTGERGTGDQLYLYSAEFAPKAVIRGTYAFGKAPKTVRCSNDFPEYTCASELVGVLESAGITCTKGPADLRTIFKAPQSLPAEDLTCIGKTLSPSLDRIVVETNHASNNLYAETLFLSIGKAVSGKGDRTSARSAMETALGNMGISEIGGLHQHDGSGMSTNNLVSSEFLCTFLRTMTSLPCYGEYLESLPSPGANGTLKTRMIRSDEALKSRVRMKSGTMFGVRSFSGYILPSKEGGKTVIFSIIFNNCTAQTSRMGLAADSLVEAFAKEVE